MIPDLINCVTKLCQVVNCSNTLIRHFKSLQKIWHFFCSSLEYTHHYDTEYLLHFFTDCFYQGTLTRDIQGNIS